MRIFSPPNDNATIYSIDYLVYKLRILGDEKQTFCNKISLFVI